MNFFKFFSYILGNGFLVGGVSVIAVMILITINVILRLLGSPILGTYEISEAFQMAGGGFILAYAALYGVNIEVTVLTKRFPSSIQKFLKILTSIISLIFWGIILWQSTIHVLRNGINDRTLVTNMMMLPYQIIWLLGLINLIIVLIKNFNNTIKNNAIEEVQIEPF